MRPQKVEEQALLNGLMSVLRAKGYDGSSLNELASASGLQKASLYHRFPGGKKEITQAVLHYVSEWVQKSVYEPLVDKTTLPVQRLEKVLENINGLYNRGESSCLLRSLSIDSGIALFGMEIKETMQAWIDGFVALGMDCGFSGPIAREKALQALIQLQGSLVVGTGIGSTAPFVTALQFVKKMYQEK